MGQQQLLLIALGLILVAAAIFGALNFWDEYTFNTSLDNLRVVTDVLLNDAYKNYIKSEEQGGGARKTFARWTPSQALLSSPLLIKKVNKKKTAGSKNQATFYITTNLTDSKKKNIPIQGSVDKDNQRTRTWYDSGTKKWYRF